MLTPVLKLYDYFHRQAKCKFPLYFFVFECVQIVPETVFVLLYKCAKQNTILNVFLQVVLNYLGFKIMQNMFVVKLIY